jgi:hypothetical protein
VKKKIPKIFGIGLTLVLAVGMVAGFALPAHAAVEKINEWYTFDYPAAGSAGDWFRQGTSADGELIGGIGPMAEAINGDLYAAAGIGPECTLESDATASWSTTQAYSGKSSVFLSVDSDDEYAELYFPVSIKLGDIDLTKTSYWCKLTSGDYIPYLMFELDTDPVVRINDDAPASAGFANWAEYDVSSGPDAWQNDGGFTGVAGPSGWATWDETVEEFGADTLVTGVLVENSGYKDVDAYIDYVTIDGATYDLEATCDPVVGLALRSQLMKSTDGGRTWAATGYEDVDGSGPIVDMVCSSIDEDIVYVTDGNYVYKTDDGGDTFDLVAQDSLEEALEGACGCAITHFPITSIDVGYDDDDNPFVFIGTLSHYADCLEPPDFVNGSVYYIGEGGFPATWTDLDLSCYSTGDYGAYAVGCAPNFADSKETYVVVSNGYETHVVSTIGVTCSWTEFAELLWDCSTGNDFGILAASRIGFPDDWEDTETLFVGVVDDNPCAEGPGGDVYRVTEDGATDLNVAGIVTGCEGDYPVDIISLDVKGDTDEASLIAGAFCTTDVYYSTDGGWSWDVSEKNPTGVDETYVLWYEDSALAATSGTECAVSMSCGEEAGQYWNQISLIATDIAWVQSLGFSPGYVCEESETMFMLSWNTVGDDVEGCAPTSSLFRYDGTYWERVYLGNPVDGTAGTLIGTVYVSPDFNTTNTLYVAQPISGIFGTLTELKMWQSADAGCSWKQLTFPCSPRPTILSAVVIDEDTVIAGGAGSDAGTVFKTTRHGARPWDDYEVDTEGDINSFALEPGYEDPGTVLLGTTDSEVFISEDGGETWDLVGDFADVFAGPAPTWVTFDPGYATNHTIYAASGDVIARCIIDPDEDWADQEWEEIYTIPTCPDGTSLFASGIVAAGDTALYVTDISAVATVTDTTCPDYTNGGVLRSLNPLEEDADEVVFERLTDGLVFEDLTAEPAINGTMLRDIFLTCDVSDDGCAENVLWSLDVTMNLDKEMPTPAVEEWANVWVYEDTLAAPVVLTTPVEGQKLTTTDEATLSWKALCGADCYEVSLWSYCPECPDLKEEVDISRLMDCHDDTCYSDTCITVDKLDPGTTYYWQVRVCYGEPKLSKWSEERTFTTALETVVNLCSPVCGGQDIILTPNFSWDKVPGATGYEVQLATTETFTVGVVKGKTTVNAWKPGVTLEYGTPYYWRVRALKDSIYSDWTVCIFTTMEEPVPPTPPVQVTIPPAPPAPVINIPAATMITPTWIYAIIGVGAALAIVVIALIVRTRRPPV